MTQEAFLRALEEKRNKEAAIAASLADAPDEEVEPLLRTYLCCKYFLRQDELTTDDLLVLGQRSTAKVAGLEKDGLNFPEKGAGCTTASSGLIKKVLLAMALGKMMGILLDPDDVAEAETIGDLAALAVRTRRMARS